MMALLRKICIYSLNFSNKESFDLFEAGSVGIWRASKVLQAGSIDKWTNAPPIIYHQTYIYIDLNLSKEQEEYRNCT